MIKYSTFTFLLMVFNATAADFEYQIPLEVATDTPAADASAYTLQLPQVVYEKARDPLLRDVRVKNKQGDEVPMRLTLSQDDIKRSLSETTVPIFSLNHTVSTPLRSKQVSTTWQGDVQQFSVETSESVQNYIRSQEQVLHDRFLLDATSLKQASVSAIELKWQFDSPGNRVFYVEVKGSHDLSNWQTVNSRQKLIELNTGQRVVLENTIPLHGNTFAYYQLRFMGEPVPEVIEVKALMSSHALDQPLITQRIKSFQVLDAEKFGHAITWETSGYFPVESVTFDFDYKNLMADVKLYSKANEKAHWQNVSNSQLYQVGSGDMAMEKNSLTFQSNNHKFWKLSSQSSISSQWIEGVSMSWRPYQLQFLAQGNGPYNLLFSDQTFRATPSSRWYQQLNSTMRKDMFSNEIKAGSMVKLTPKTEPEPKPESQLSRWIFWGLLVIVLSGLFYMASRLMREVSSGE